MADLSGIDASTLLNGKCFITTRPYGKSKELADILQKYGARLLELPMIELSESECDEKECELLNNYKKYTHIAFTSAYGFRFFYEKTKEHDNFRNWMDSLKIVSIGYKTSELIRSYGLPIEFDAKAKTGREFADRFIPYLKGKKAKVIWATGTLSPNQLTKRVAEVANITRINLYKNTVPEDMDNHLLQKIKQGDYDMLVLASPSAFKNLYAMVESNDLRIVCIGHTTASAAKAHGITPLAVSNEPTSHGIAEAIVKYYKNNKLDESSHVKNE
ncbi:Uroporphyrinogen-III synthase [Saccharicrinis carchari]|uniref:Uroporphyrinogen-III synthase n=1 Tax=Saccharicrinis carchari TaxID=1168039 RepID=A0A521EP16_SACCC|nr:uroporphyrinogen-III synthase [Saccharicrinis carchari]SMO85669.1 Uroporphyrinogen-III synthase [Saccharicrinis carchari]